MASPLTGLAPPAENAEGGPPAGDSHKRPRLAADASASAPSASASASAPTPAAAAAFSAYELHAGVDELPLGARFEATCCHVAQAGYRVQAAAYVNVSPATRHDERLLWGVRSVRFGLHWRTTLMAAAHFGDAERVAELLHHGSAVNARDDFGCSPLSYALAGGHDSCAALLRGAGAVDDAPFAGELRLSCGPVVAMRGAHTWDDQVFSLVALRALRNGKLASGAEDRTVRVWDTATGACEAVLAGHQWRAWALTELLDGRLVSGSEDSTVRVWDPKQAYACTAVLPQEDGCMVHALAALPCGGFASGNSSGRIELWSAACERVATLGAGEDYGGVTSLALLPDGRIAVGHWELEHYPDYNQAGMPPVIRLWSVKRRELDAILVGHVERVEGVTALPDGRVVSCSFDKSVIVWDASVLDERDECECFEAAAETLTHTSGVLALTVLPDGSLASGDVGGVVHLWH